MRSIFITGLVVMAGIAAAFGTAARAAGDGYALNPGDLLFVSVWKEEGMQHEILVLPDGTISFPLAGHIKAAGTTAAEVEKALTERIKRYIPEPVVTVAVSKIGGYKIYVIGQVNRPGEFLISRDIDVMQALTLAGGLTPFGDEDDIKVLRRQGEKLNAIDFNYSDIERGKNLDQNIILQAGDIVVVPE